MKLKKFDFILSGVIILLLILESDISMSYFNKYNYFAIIFWLVILYFVTTILIYLVRYILKKFRKTTSLILVLVILLLLIFKPFTIHNFNIYYKENSVSGYTLYEKKSFGCAEALELIYTDSEHAYYFSCIRSQNYFITNGFDRFTIKEGLDKNKIKIEDLLSLLDDAIIVGDKSMFSS